MSTKKPSKRDQKAMAEVKSRLRTLVRYPHFSGLSSANLHKLVQLCTEHSFRKNEVILKEGEVAHSMYFLRAGSAVAIMGNTLVQRYSMTPGSGGFGTSVYMGELGILKKVHEQPSKPPLCAASVIAAENKTRCLRLRYEQIESTIAAITTDASLRTAIQRYSLTALEMVGRIFDILDSTRSGLLAFPQICDLSYKTAGVAMEHNEYTRVAQAVGCDADEGIDLQGLRRIYLELYLGDVRNDYDVITAGATSAVLSSKAANRTSRSNSNSLLTLDLRSSQTEGSAVSDFLSRHKSPARDRAGSLSRRTSMGSSAVTEYLRTSSSSARAGATSPLSPRPPGEPSAVAQYMRSQSPRNSISSFNGVGTRGEPSATAQFLPSPSPRKSRSNANGVHWADQNQQTPRSHQMSLELSVTQEDQSATIAKLQAQLADAEAALASQAAASKIREDAAEANAAATRTDLAAVSRELFTVSNELAGVRRELGLKSAELMNLRAGRESDNAEGRKAEIYSLCRKLEGEKANAIAQIAEEKAVSDVLRDELTAAKAAAAEAGSKCAALSKELQTTHATCAELQLQLQLAAKTNGSQASTDTTSTRAKTRGALLGGLRSGALEQAVAKMEQEEEQQLPLPPSPPPPQQQPSVGGSNKREANGVSKAATVSKPAPSPPMPAPTPAPVTASATHQELKKLKISELRRRATAQGIERSFIENAIESGRPKAALIQLLEAATTR